MDEKGERRKPGDLGSGPGRPKQGRVTWVGQEHGRSQLILRGPRRTRSTLK